MRSRQHFVDAYHAATQAESELWARIEGHGPGQPGFDRELWEKWLQAVALTNATSRALREAFAVDAPESDDYAI